MEKRLPYMFYYVSNRKDLGLRGLKPDTPIEQDYLAAQFYGNTNDLLAVYFQYPGCVRVLDPEGGVVAEATTPARVTDGGFNCRCVLNVDRPRLWWPRGYGGQPLYRAQVTLLAGDHPQQGTLPRAVSPHQGGDHTAVAAGDEFFLESVVVARASGRPHLAHSALSPA